MPELFAAYVSYTSDMHEAPHVNGATMRRLLPVLEGSRIHYDQGDSVLHLNFDWADFWNLQLTLESTRAD